MNLGTAYLNLAAAQTELRSQRAGADADVNAAVRDALSYIAAAKAALDKAEVFLGNTTGSVAA